METGRPRKHRSLLAEFLNKLETKEPAKIVVENAKDSAPVDTNKKKRDAESTK